MTEVFRDASKDAGYCQKCQKGYAIGPHVCPSEAEQRPSNQRDAFELWAEGNHWNTRRNPYNQDMYQSDYTQYGWWAWKAARAADEPPAAPDRQRLRNQIGGLDLEPDCARSDNLAIALCSYFEDLPDCPEDGELDETDTWKAWAVERTNGVLDRLTDLALRPAEPPFPDPDVAATTAAEEPEASNDWGVREAFKTIERYIQPGSALPGAVRYLKLEIRKLEKMVMEESARASEPPPPALSELQSISGSLGAGGSDCIDAAELAKRIRWAVDHHIRATLERAASTIEPTHVTTLVDKDVETKRDARESGVRRRLAAEIRALMPEGRAPEPPGNALVCVGQLIQLDDGLGTVFADWNEERFKLEPGTKLYAQRTSETKVVGDE